MMSVGVEADDLGQDAVAALADLDFALDRVGLPLLVERHDDDGGAVGAHELRLFDERAPRLP